MAEFLSVQIDLTTLSLAELRLAYTLAAQTVNAVLAEAQRRQDAATDTEWNEPDSDQTIDQPAPVAAKALHPVTEAGMYRHDGEIYKVQKAVHGSGHLYAKLLVVSTSGDPGDPDTSVGFEYAPGMIRKLYAEDRMTLDQAKEFGALYGTCMVCGRTLTNETSIEAGIGPVCGNRI